jgi:HlyD family secretion protein
MDRPVVAAARFMRLSVLAYVGAALAIAAGILAFPSIRSWSRADRAVDATTVRTAAVTRGDLQRDLWVQARVVASLHPALFSPAQGVVAIEVKPGREVRSGQVLATVESSELRSALAQAESQLASLHADYERQKIVTRQTELRGARQVELLTVRADAARRALDRAERAFREGIGNRAELESAQDAARVATIEMEQAKKDAGLDGETLAFELRDRLEQVRRQESAAGELRRKADALTVRAPFDGMVATVNVQDRDAVAPNQALLTIVNLSSFELEIAVPEEYSRETRIGLPATIRVGDRDCDGRVTAVSPEVVNGQITGTVAFAGRPPVGLKQSQRVTVRLLFESKKNVLKVARGAFADSGGARIAYVVDGNLALRRAIALGDSSGTEVEIVSGLREGERVITSDVSVFERAGSVLLR